MGADRWIRTCCIQHALPFALASALLSDQDMILPLLLSTEFNEHCQ